jgi:hypothetical protein
VDLVKRAGEHLARPRPAANGVEGPVIDRHQPNPLVERLLVAAAVLEAEVLGPPFRAVEPAEGGDRQHRHRRREADEEDDTLRDADLHGARV